MKNNRSGMFHPLSCGALLLLILLMIIVVTVRISNDQNRIQKPVIVVLPTFAFDKLQPGRYIVKRLVDPKQRKAEVSAEYLHCDTGLYEPPKAIYVTDIPGYTYYPDKSFGGKECPAEPASKPIKV